MALAIPPNHYSAQHPPPPLQAYSPSSFTLISAQVSGSSRRRSCCCCCCSTSNSSRRIATISHADNYRYSSSSSSVLLPHRSLSSVAEASTLSLAASPTVIHRSRSRVEEEEEEEDVMRELERWGAEEILPFLKPIEKMWQPQDLLPEPTSESFFDEVRDLRSRSRDLPDEYMVCLVGNTITEEALPTYQSSMYRFLGACSDDQASSWATWARSWTAEENRHGDLLHKYLYLSGKVDMRMVEKTIQYLIQSGMDVGLQNNPYLGFIYTSFQERATFISHGNIARQAKEFGDMRLARICGSIAADEKRHEHAYTKVVGKLFDIHPDGTMLALEAMLRKKIVMPAHLMYDGRDENLYDHFSNVAQRMGVYTSKDYADNVEHFVKKWGLEQLRLETSEGRAAQEYVCNLSMRVRKIEERAHRNTSAKPPKYHQFSWIFNHEVML